MARKVAIVGAAISGLVPDRCRLQEGLEPTCFARSDYPGGLWRLAVSDVLFILSREYVEEGRPGLYKSVVSNSCKEMTCYSEFPFPEDYPNYMPNSLFLEYLRMYANRFDLLKCIQFKTKVCSVTKHPDFTVTGQWEVVTLCERKQESATFDAVMVCTGFLTDPHLPLDSFPGIKTFKGQYFHSQQYKHPDTLKDKRVLVIGLGNSGTDIAVEASHVAKQLCETQAALLPLRTLSPLRIRHAPQNGSTYFKSPHKAFVSDSKGMAGKRSFRPRPSKHLPRLPRTVPADSRRASPGSLRGTSAFGSLQSDREGRGLTSGTGTRTGRSDPVSSGSQTLVKGERVSSPFCATGKSRPHRSTGFQDPHLGRPEEARTCARAGDRLQTAPPWSAVLPATRPGAAWTDRPPLEGPRATLGPLRGTQLKEFVLNDILPGCIIAGKVFIKPSVKEVKENSVLFNSVPKEEPIDIIVFTTGYTFAFPFLDETVVKVEDGQASLYKYIFPARLQKPPLAVIGLIKLLASIISTSEVQARWAVLVLKGINKLPPSSVMIAEVNARKEKKPSGFGLCYCKALEVDYIPYIDELLTYINTKPNLFSIFLTDPRLAFTIFFGPCAPYQFRLTGPGKREGARNAILTQRDRSLKATKTRIVQESSSPFASLLKLFSFLALLGAIFLIFL
ncbi:Dimethylaniline monooxygenase [N-oxide-forming] 1 [Pteropus alecto]|uniref:Flavin-containing monooxygenase n=1 Tax=Pteropus alecto TaxID=9402 RepID=L5KZ41_PTEAL|nr:Dimethylaniline monooxygenase [N-oxide-forming] 1 [Pteropus alecto]